jgi:hypothetical protein
MNTLPADSHCEFISPLAPQLARFLALKHAMGYRYEKRAAYCTTWTAFSTLGCLQTIP